MFPPAHLQIGLLWVFYGLTTDPDGGNPPCVHAETDLTYYLSGIDLDYLELYIPIT